MNWSVYAKFVGNVFGAPLAIEGLAAFFLEAMTGYKAQAAWGAVHLALPTNEDRAKAAVDWAGAATTHQRAGRITVEAE